MHHQVWDWDVAAPDDCLGVGSVDLTRHLALALARNERVLKKAKALEAEKASPASAAAAASAVVATTTSSKAKTSSELNHLTPAQRMKRQAKEAANDAKDAMEEAAKDAQEDAKKLAKKFRKKEAVSARLKRFEFVELFILMFLHISHLFSRVGTMILCFLFAISLTSSFFFGIIFSRCVGKPLTQCLSRINS